MSSGPPTKKLRQSVLSFVRKESITSDGKQVYVIELATEPSMRLIRFAYLPTQSGAPIFSGMQYLNCKISMSLKIFYITVRFT